MLTISLTSIPPRFAGLGTVLDSLLAQEAVARVVLSLPRRYARFPGPFAPPRLPGGVELLWAEEDLGPATKVLPLAATLPPDAPILWCDDDWAYGPGWAAGFAAAHAADPAAALAAAPFDARRIGGGSGTIVQGFAGVLATPAMLAPLTAPDGPFREVDDIWLSGLLAANGTPIRPLPHLRALATPTGNEAASLQATGRRAALNRSCAAQLSERMGIWR